MLASHLGKWVIDITVSFTTSLVLVTAQPDVKISWQFLKAYPVCGTKYVVGEDTLTLYSV